MKNRSTNFAFSIALALQFGCNVFQKPAASGVLAEPAPVEAFLYKPGGFYAFCAYREGEISKEATLPIDRQFCSSVMLASACDQQASTISDTAQSLLEANDIAFLKRFADEIPELRKQLEELISEEARSCLDRGQFLADLMVKDHQVQPKNIARLEAGRKRFWRYAFRAAMELGVRGGLAYYQSAFKTRMKAMIRYAVCSGAAAVGGRLLDKAGESSHKVACMNTISSTCSALGGFVNLQKVVTDDEVEGVVSAIATIANVGLEAACDANGVTIACGFISESLAQIRKAIETGNNDWAECLGISEASRKLGESYVESITGVSQKHLQTPVMKSFNFDGTAHNLCCRCNRSYYSDYLLGDEKFRSDSVLQLTLEPGIDYAIDKFCESYEKRPLTYLSRKYQGDTVYYRYEQCEQVMIVGAETCEYTQDGFSSGRKLPTKRLSGQPIAGRTNFFGPAQIVLGTMWCKNERCN